MTEVQEVVTVSSLWPEVKMLVESADVDVLKAARGNALAGVRARKALRLLKQKVALVVKQSVEEAKTKRALKPKREKKQK